MQGNAPKPTITDDQLYNLANNKRLPQTYRSVGEVVEGLRRRYASAVGSELERIRAAWSDLAGPELGEISFPSALRKGILVVSVASSAAKYEIEQVHRTMFLQRLRAACPGIGRLQDIRCLVEGAGEQ